MYLYCRLIIDSIFVCSHFIGWLPGWNEAVLNLFLNCQDLKFWKKKNQLTCKFTNGKRLEIYWYNRKIYVWIMNSEKRKNESNVSNTCHWNRHFQYCYEKFIATLFRYILLCIVFYYCSNFPMLSAQALNTLKIDSLKKGNEEGKKCWPHLIFFS